MFFTTGPIRYGSEGYSVVLVDPEIARYYRSFIPKHIHFNVPMWEPHVTVTRTGVEFVGHTSEWKKHDGEMFTIRYSPHIMIGKSYIWLPAFSDEIRQLRIELGLPPFFDNFKKLHITIANMKGTRSEHRCEDYGQHCE